MKNLISTTFVAIMLTALMPASVHAGGIGGAGLKGGLAIATLGNQDDDFSDVRARFRLGGTGGFSYEMATDGTFAFDLELLYDLRGAKQKLVSNSNSEIIVKDYLHYLNVPMSLKFYIGDVFNVHFGGYVGVAIGGKRKIEGSGTVGSIMFEANDEFNLFGDDIKDPQGDEYLNRFDGGIHFGVEFIGEKGVGVGSRAYIGLADITNDQHILGNNKSTTAEISVYAIFRFDGD